jgi:uncharacterized protein YbjT (DUF2867 family)
MILITGAAGKTGQAVIAALHAKEVDVRGLVRKQGQADAAHGGEVVIGDLADPQTAINALQGTDGVYFICPNVHPAELEIAKTWITAAKTVGIKRFVFHSVLFPQIESMPHHWQKLKVEEELIKSDLDFTVLQPASYMQNILGYVPAIRAAGEYRVPYSIDAQFSPIDLRDVAEVASTVLLEDGHRGAIYPLAGAEILTSADMASFVGSKLGKQITASQQSIDEWSETSTLPDYAHQTLIKMFTFYEQHGFVGSPHLLRSLLDGTPTTFAQFLDRELK